MLNKKAQGISINTIIIAAIALIVLVVLITIFTGNMGQWIKNIFKIQHSVCETTNVQGKTTLNGHWSPNPCPEGKQVYPADQDDQQAHNGQYCCIA